MIERTISPPPDENHLMPKNNIFIKNDFDNAIWENGYTVWIEDAVSCPCKGMGSAPQSTCNNCLGTGWIFIAPKETRALMTSINKNTKYKDWNPQFIGTVAITPISEIKLSFMSRVTIKGNTSRFSEVVFLRNIPNPVDNFTKYVFLTYRPNNVLNIYVYDGINNRLLKVDSSRYRPSTNPFVIEVDINLLLDTDNGAISVTYTHELSYNIIDLPHDMRMTKEYDNTDKRRLVDMPVSAIGRKSQYELGVSSNYSYNNLIDNA